MNDLNDEGLEESPKKGGGKIEERVLPKRFYKTVTVSELEEGFGIELDGRTVKTPGRVSFMLPVRALADVAAKEWQDQETHIDPALMPLTALANTAIDRVGQVADAVREEITSFAGSDLLCYRAETPAGLAARQSEHWDPVLKWFEGEFGARFDLAGGIMPITQPQDSLDQVAATIKDVAPLPLAAIQVITSITGSALLAIALARRHLTDDYVWKAAHVDEDWQIEKWGRDEEAETRRAARHRDFAAAALVLNHH